MVLHVKVNKDFIRLKIATFGNLVKVIEAKIIEENIHLPGTLPVHESHFR